MDASAVKEIVMRHIENLLQLFQLQDRGFEINIKVVEDTQGQCTVDHDYGRFWITLNPEEMKDEDQVLDILRHELFHTLHDRLWLYRSAVKEFVSETEFKALDVVFTHAMEDLILKLERMFTQGMGIDATLLAKFAAKKNAKQEGD